MASGTLRVTSRQGIQYHFVRRGDHHSLLATLNHHLVTTLGACGDVVRNIMCCPAPLSDRRRAEVEAYALVAARRFRPRTQAYYQGLVDLITPERRRQGKTDPIDAVEAARAAQSGRAFGTAKTRSGNVEAIRALMVAMRSARSTKIKTLNQIRHLGFTAPDELRDRLHGLSRRRVGAEAAGLRPRAGGEVVAFATKTALRVLGRRVLILDEEIASLHELLAELVAQTAPDLLAVHGVGVDTAALLLVAAGDNPERLRSEAAWAHLCGTAPIQASSGKVTRYRLNRGGDRHANHALYCIAVTRMSSDPRTRAYVQRRTAEGKSKREIIRILKRYIAREIYRYLPRG